MFFPCILRSNSFENSHGALHVLAHALPAPELSHAHRVPLKVLGPLSPFKKKCLAWGGREVRGPKGLMRAHKAPNAQWALPRVCDLLL